MPVSKIEGLNPDRIQKGLSRMVRVLVARANAAPIWWRDVAVDGRILRAPTLDRLLSLHSHRLGLVNRSELRLLQTLVKPGMTAVDVGANQGLYTLLLSRLVGPTGRVIACEPEPSMHACLCANLERNRAGNVEVHPIALGATRGVLPLHRPAFNSGDSRIKPAAPDGPGLADANLVQVVPLDELIGDQALHLVKIDVQGWEDAVLAGMEKILRRRAEIHVVLEFWPAGLRRAGTEPASLLDRLWAHGLQIRKIDGHANPRVESSEDLLRQRSGRRYVNIHAHRALHGHAASAARA